MNFLHGQQGQQQNAEEKSGGGGLMGKLNDQLGGGQAGERSEDVVDKGVDWVQERVLNQGPQDNESAVEQVKDQQISGFIKRQYKGATGNDIPFTGNK